MDVIAGKLIAVRRKAVLEKHVENLERARADFDGSQLLYWRPFAVHEDVRLQQQLSKEFIL